MKPFLFFLIRINDVNTIDVEIFRSFNAYDVFKNFFEGIGPFSVLFEDDAGEEFNFGADFEEYFRGCIGRNLQHKHHG